MSKKTVIVTGGAGYVGSHACFELAKNGYKPVIIDNFSNSKDTNGACLKFDWYRVSLSSYQRLHEIFREVRPDAVMHFAGKIEVGESMKSPLLYYQENVADALNLLWLCKHFKVSDFVFSSTCATYGNPVQDLNEQHPQFPINVYGRTKLMFEHILNDAVATGELDTSVSILRYFNVCGADTENMIGESHDPETHVIPLLIKAATEQKPFTVFGNDYDTHDGTCIRDYVDVRDLARAHVMALDRSRKANEFELFDYNLGSSIGTSIMELIRLVEEETGSKINVKFGKRREGDPSSLIADSTKAYEQLGWHPTYTIQDSVREAINWDRIKKSVSSIVER